MSYLVFARKYRPQTFDEVAGQEAVSATLKNAVRTGRIAHGYLFCGPRGVGKTSMARIFAKAVNCPHRENGEPCNKCDVCTSITDGSAMDVVEIDGASNRGIDDIRQLRESVKYAPANFRYKVYIIDEVHQITNEGFNALLKTLEEPPEHVKFVFATTDPQKVPQTILSRCQRFDFVRLSSKVITAVLETIMQKEGIEADRAALEAIAIHSHGGMRDAESRLDMVVNVSGGRITVAEVEGVLGLLSTDFLAGLVGHILRGEIASVIGEFRRLLEDGHDPVDFLENLVRFYHWLMLAKTVGREGVNAELGDDLAGKLETIAGEIAVEALASQLELLLLGIKNMRGLTQAEIMVEVLLVKMVNLSNLAPLRGMLDEVRALSDKLSASGKIVYVNAPSGGSAGAAPVPVPNAERARTDETPPVTPSSPPPSKKNFVTNVADDAQSIDEAAPDEAPAGGGRDIVSEWQDFVSAFAKRSVRLAGYLKQAVPRGADDKRLIVDFGNKAHMNQISREREAVEAAVAEFTGRRLSLTLEIAETRATGDDPGGVEADAPGTRNLSMEEARKDDITRRIEEALDAKIINVEKTR